MLGFYLVQVVGLIDNKDKRPKGGLDNKAKILILLWRRVDQLLFIKFYKKTSNHLFEASWEAIRQIYWLLFCIVDIPLVVRISRPLADQVKRVKTCLEQIYQLPSPKLVFPCHNTRRKIQI